jgi:cell division septal protein FtsQ
MNRLARNNPKKIPASMPSVVMRVASFATVLLVTVVVAVIGSGVSVDVMKVVAVNIEELVAVEVVVQYWLGIP